MSTRPDTPDPALSPAPFMETAPAGSAESIWPSPLRWETSSASVATGTTSTPVTNTASWASMAGTKTFRYPCSLATATMGRMPFVCLRPPSRASSPRKIADSGSCATWPEESSTASAMGRS